MAMRTSVVGSWWPLSDLDDQLRTMHRKGAPLKDAEALLKACATRAIVEQRDLGLTEWTGGEYSSDEFLNHMQKVLTGIKITRPSRPEIFDYDDMAEATITGTIDAPNGMGYAAAYALEAALPGGVTKATVVGPLEMAFNMFGDYPRLLKQLPNLIKVVNKEIRALAAAGCPCIQLDVPTAATLMSMGAMTPEDIAKIVSQCFEGVSGIRRGIHICSGNLRGRPLSGNLSAAPWAQVVAKLDGKIEFAHLAVHYFARFLEREAYSIWPKSVDLIAGIVDEGCYEIEPVWKIRERAEAWAKVVGEERLWIAPSCGFGRHPIRDVPVLRQKMANMVEAANSF